MRGSIVKYILQTRLMLASADGYFYIYNIPEQVFSLALISSPDVNAGRGLCDGETAQT